MTRDTKPTTDPKSCGACGETFGCSANLEGCWCAEIIISDATAAELKARYADCLCPKCLVVFAAGPAMVIKYPDGSAEVLAGAFRVDTQNFHEGMFDFYDERGTLLRQVDMGSGIEWDEVGTDHK